MQAHIRPATRNDLTAINAVVEAGVMGWDLPERVKRLSLDSYLYRAEDLDHLDLFVAENDEREIIGVAALENADEKDLPQGKRGLLLHGLYVDPKYRGGGIGRQLLDHAIVLARSRNADGLLVKAQPDANGFFAAIGGEALAVENPGRDYPHRWWFSAGA